MARGQNGLKNTPKEHPQNGGQTADGGSWPGPPICCLSAVSGLAKLCQVSPQSHPNFSPMQPKKAPRKSQGLQKAHKGHHKNGRQTVDALLGAFWGALGFPVGPFGIPFGRPFVSLSPWFSVTVLVHVASSLIETEVNIAAWWRTTTRIIYQTVPNTLEII